MFSNTVDSCVPRKLEFGARKKIEKNYLFNREASFKKKGDSGVGMRMQNVAIGKQKTGFIPDFPKCDFTKTRRIDLY